MAITSYLITNKELIGIICDILTSIGTVGAVIVALYLTYRSNHPIPKIRAEAEFNYFHQHDDLPDTEGTPVISVSIANISTAPIEINAIGWVFGFHMRFIKKRVSYQKPNEIIPHLSTRLPATVNFGQDIQILIGEKSFINNASLSLPTKVRCSFLNRLNAYFCYLFIQDSIGNFYYVRVNKRLREKIYSAISETIT